MFDIDQSTCLIIRNNCMSFHKANTFQSVGGTQQHETTNKTHISGRSSQLSIWVDIQVSRVPRLIQSDSWKKTQGLNRARIRDGACMLGSGLREVRFEESQRSSFEMFHIVWHSSLHPHSLVWFHSRLYFVLWMTLLQFSVRLPMHQGVFTRDDSSALSPTDSHEFEADFQLIPMISHYCRLFPVS